MGKSITPKYAVEFFGVVANGMPVRWTAMSWRGKQAGRANAVNLAKFIKEYEASTYQGQCNAHLGVTKIGAAQLLLNDGSRTIVAEYVADTMMGRLFGGTK